MFESTLEAQGLNDGERRLGSMSVAVMAHVGIGVALVAAAALVVPPIKEPEVRLVVPLVDTLRLDDKSPHPVDPLPKKEPQTPKAGNPTAPKPIELTPAPVETPTTLPDPEPTPPESDLDGRGEGPTGLPGGDEHGASGGSATGRGDGESGDGLPGEPRFLTGDMVKPVLLVKVEPSYPEVARRAGMGGRVTVSAVIGLDGGVETAEVLASTNPLFDRAALDAVRKWRYRAATMNGRPVRVYFTVVVDFVVR